MLRSQPCRELVPHGGPGTHRKWICVRRRASQGDRCPVHRGESHARSFGNSAPSGPAYRPGDSGRRRQALSDRRGLGCYGPKMVATCGGSRRADRWTYPAPYRENMSPITGSLPRLCSSTSLLVDAEALDHRQRPCHAHVQTEASCDREAFRETRSQSLHRAYASNLKRRRVHPSGERS